MAQCGGVEAGSSLLSLKQGGPKILEKIFYIVPRGTLK
jgi:hypothetical protein